MASRFTRTREDFVCEHCGESVRGNGYTNHCPRCLWSKHVDVSPGDRAADCGALMRPVAAVPAGNRVIVVQRCTGCGHIWRNRSTEEDNRELLHALVGVPVTDDRPSSRPLPAVAGDRAVTSARRSHRRPRQPRGRA